MTRGAEIIVVDDDMGMSQAIERLLAAAGWKVRSFGSAEALLASGAEFGAAVLILDLQLPGISGLTLFNLLTAKGHVPPVIFITAQDRPDTRNLARRCGAAGYFTKPFSGSELIQAVRELLPAHDSPLS